MEEEGKKVHSKHRSLHRHSVSLCFVFPQIIYPDVSKVCVVLHSLCVSQSAGLIIAGGGLDPEDHGEVKGCRCPGHAQQHSRDRE